MVKKIRSKRIVRKAVIAPVVRYKRVWSVGELLQLTSAFLLAFLIMDFLLKTVLP